MLGFGPLRFYMLQKTFRGYEGSKSTQPAGGKTTENVAEQAADEEDLTKAPAVPIVAEPQLVLGENSGKAKVGKDGKDRTAPYG